VEILLVGVVVSVILVNEFFRTGYIVELKKRNLKIWEDLGRPSGYFSSYLFKANGFAFEKFIFRKEYEKLDGLLRSKGNTLFKIQLVYFLVIALFFIAIISKLVLFPFL